MGGPKRLWLHMATIGSGNLTRLKPLFRDHDAILQLEVDRLLLARWGFSDESTDPVVNSVLDKAAVTFAFAELKIGRCTPGQRFYLQGGP